MNITKFIYTFSLLIMYGAVWAQGAPPATPIDGGLTFALLATGAAIGIKKVRESGKKKQ